MNHQDRRRDHAWANSSVRYYVGPSDGPSTVARARPFHSAARPAPAGACTSLSDPKGRPLNGL